MTHSRFSGGEVTLLEKQGGKVKVPARIQWTRSHRPIGPVKSLRHITSARSDITHPPHQSGVSRSEFDGEVDPVGWTETGVT
jgi:hypothetical protein